MCGARIIVRSCLPFLLLLLSAAAYADDLTENTIPDVNFAIVRLDYQTFTIKGSYEFSHSYRKSLPDEGYEESGNVFYRIVYPCDFGYTRLMSRLTGELLVHAASVWMGTGAFHYPPDSLFNPTYQDGYVNPAPDTLIYLPLYGTAEQYADLAWSKVHETDIIHRLSSVGSCEVVLFDHFYTVGPSNPNTAEWIVVAFTHPPAPDDLAMVKLNWPKTLVTENVDFVPELVVHNFSDRSLSAKVDLTMTGDYGFIGEWSVVLDPLPADSSCTVFFDPVTLTESGSASMDYQFVQPDGSPWIDAYPDNDSWHQDIEVIDQPVFRPISSARHPGHVPLNGKALDFDDDGDFDIFQLSRSCKLWQNDGAGNFVDITHLSSFPFTRDAREVITEDFNGDGHSDLLLVGYSTTPVFLLGDGTGVFVDATENAGLSDVMGYGDVDAFDRENDGDQDVIFESRGQEVLFENDGTGYFTDVTTTSGVVDPAQTERVTVGDINDDGSEDLVLTNWGSPSTVFINNRSGQFSLIDGQWDFIYGRDAVIFDFDGDGLQDILFTRSLYVDESLLYKNIGNLEFVEVSSDLGGLPSAFCAAVADLDNDGSLDLLLTDLDEWTLLIYEDNVYAEHTELLVDREEELLGSVYGQSRPQFVDLDGDGDLDIYSRCIVFENQGLCSPYAPGDRPPVPKSYLLGQNYPNPFNATTAILYNLPAGEAVHIAVYDVTGRLVRTLVNGWKPAGTHTVYWDGCNESRRRVASGVYLYRLKTSHYRCTRKLLLLK